MTGASVNPRYTVILIIILDLNEKSGWTERNAKREFYAHAHTIVGSEKSLRHALDIIRKTLAEAKRIRVKVRKMKREKFPWSGDVHGGRSESVERRSA